MNRKKPRRMRYLKTYLPPTQNQHVVWYLLDTRMVVLWSRRLKILLLSLDKARLAASFMTKRLSFSENLRLGWFPNWCLKLSLSLALKQKSDLWLAESLIWLASFWKLFLAKTVYSDDPLKQIGDLENFIKVLPVNDNLKNYYNGLFRHLELSRNTWTEWIQDRPGHNWLVMQDQFAYCQYLQPR